MHRDPKNTRLSEGFIKLYPLVLALLVASSFSIGALQAQERSGDSTDALMEQARHRATAQDDFESADKASVFQGGITIEGYGDATKVLYVGSSGSYSFFNSWDSTTGTPRNVYLSGNVGIKALYPQADLHVSGGAGSAELLLEADTNNAGEADQPKITLSQDGGIVKGQLGYFDSSNHMKLINNYGGAKVLLKQNGDVCIGSSC